MTVTSGEFILFVKYYNDLLSAPGKCYFQEGKGFTIRERKKSNITVLWAWHLCLRVLISRHRNAGLQATSKQMGKYH